MCQTKQVNGWQTLVGSSFPYLESFDCWYACFESVLPCSDVRIFGLSTFENLFVGWRIIGKGTSCYVTLTICTHCDISFYFDKPNWVRIFPPLFVLVEVFVVLFVKGLCAWMLCSFLRYPQWLCKATCMVPSCLVASSFPWWGPRHMHATSSSCRDVLQVEVARGLHQSLSSYALVPLRARVGVVWVRHSFLFMI